VKTSDYYMDDLVRMEKGEGDHFIVYSSKDGVYPGKSAIKFEFVKTASGE